jgi:hypothetical protein
LLVGLVGGVFEAGVVVVLGGVVGLLGATGGTDLNGVTGVCGLVVVGAIGLLDEGGVGLDMVAGG